MRGRPVLAGALPAMRDAPITRYKLILWRATNAIFMLGRDLRVIYFETIITSLSGMLKVASDTLDPKIRVQIFDKKWNKLIST